MGTIPYMAAEQIQTPRDLTFAVDVYGLGAILYELLCVRPPIEGGTAAEVIKNVVEKVPEPPRRRLGAKAIDRDLDTICCKCLSKLPSDRYASAADVADDLANYLADRPITARPASRTERTWRALRRHPVSVVEDAEARDRLNKVRKRWSLRAGNCPSCCPSLWLKDRPHPTVSPRRPIPSRPRMPWPCP